MVSAIIGVASISLARDTNRAVINTTAMGLIMSALRDLNSFIDAKNEDLQKCADDLSSGDNQNTAAG
jgi:hypothetical protein